MKLHYTLASLVADALSLGPHWVYNQSKVGRLYPNGIRSFTDPASQFHPNRRAGDFTHYGDQTVLLLESLQKRGGWSYEAWREDWLAAMETFDGYRDGATKETLASSGKRPSSSNDLAGAVRIGPLLDLALPLEETVAAARAQSALTHGDPGVADAAAFFVRAVRAIEGGCSLAEGLEVASRSGDYDVLDPRSHLNAAIAANPADFLGVAAHFGLTCHWPEAFPLTLYFALRPGADFASAISDNGLAGGDTAARAMPLGLLFTARDGAPYAPWVGKLNHAFPIARAGSNQVTIPGPHGELSGVLEMPTSPPRAFALFAHCFTCGKDFLPEARITRHLARLGIATLRIDFSGLGSSGGSFAETSFLTNLDDLVAAADWMRRNHQAPRLLIGHSLGGAAVLPASNRIPEVEAAVTIGAPADPGHVTRLFADHVDEIEKEGEAEVVLAGRKFRIGKRFLDDLATYCHRDELGKIRGKDIMILHAPRDATVPLDDAGQIFSSLKHPKSFVSLANADHLLTDPKDAEFVASLIDVWANRVLQLTTPS